MLIELIGTKTPGVVSRILTGLVLAVTWHVATAHAIPATLSFGGSERKVPKSFTLAVDTIDLQTGDVVQTIRTRARPRITVDCPTRFCIAAVRGAGIATLSKRRVLQESFGTSKGFGAVVTTARARSVRLNTRTVRRLSAQSSVAPVDRGAATAGQLRVGIPAGGFTMNRELANFIGSPAGIASVITTTMVQAPCYRAEGAFSVIETDPRILRERKKEFDLIKKGYVKAEPGFTDQYRPPNANVRGSVSMTGDSATASIQLVSSSGQVIASATGSTTTGGWFEALDQAARDLAGALCPGPRVAISFAQCSLIECSCGPDSFGYRIELRAEGTAKLPVGGFMYTTVPTSSQSVHDCGGAQLFNFGSALGCSRPTADLAENFTFIHSRTSPGQGSCSCPRDGAPTEIMMIGTAMDPATGARDDAVLTSVECRVRG
jgi:hypothetical protein